MKNCFGLLIFEASISNIVKGFVLTKSTGKQDEHLQIIKSSEVMHVDETEVYVNSKRMWLML